MCSLSEMIGDVTERYRSFGYFPSAAVRVFNSRTSLCTYACGEAGDDSLFDVASLTKIATATMVLRLVSQGRLDLEDPVGRFLPEIQKRPRLKERMEQVTVLSLLTHTSSLPAWYPFYVRQQDSFFDILEDVILSMPPEKGVVYSDLGFMLLGRMLEEIHGMPLETCLQVHLVEPLGLGRMMYGPVKGKAVPSCFGNEIERDMCRERGLHFDAFRPDGVPVQGEANDGNCYYYFHGTAGHAGIFADTAAYMRLCQYYMNATDPILKRACCTQEISPGRGLGFQTTVMYPRGCGHLGFTGTSIYFSRERDIGAVIFTNRLYEPVSLRQPTNDFRRVVHELVYASV